VFNDNQQLGYIMNPRILRFKGIIRGRYAMQMTVDYNLLLSHLIIGK